MSVDLLILVIGGLLTVLSTVFWFSLNRILKRIDDLVKKMESFPETISKIYKDIHTFDHDLREQLHALELRVIKIESRCSYKHGEE